MICKYYHGAPSRSHAGKGGPDKSFHTVPRRAFSINLLVCHWEICLFLRQDYVVSRTDYWQGRKKETGRMPMPEFLATKVPFRRVLSPTVWADAWAAYSVFDDSYMDRRSCGVNVDIANGFFTPIPTLILYTAFTVNFLPAFFAGILGVALFWQWTYVTSVYWISYYVAGKHNQVSKSDLYAYLWGTNGPWVLFALLGLYVSIRLVIDGNYSVLGH